MVAIKGVDSTERSLTGAILKANGYAFACRYVQNAPGSSLDKEMSAAEVREKSAAGIRIVSNWEWGAAPANLQSLGRQHAQAFLARHKLLGGPDWAPCYYSIDTPATAGSYNNYAQGWLDIMPVERLGVYGDGALFRQLKADGFVTYAWQSMSRSFPGNHTSAGTWDHRGADIIQTTSGHVDGHSCDFDTAVVGNYGGWLLGEDDPMALDNTDADLVADHTLTRDGHIQNMAAPGDFVSLGTWSGQVNTALTNLAAAVAKLQAGTGTIDYAVLAKAVNDDAAKRLAA